MRGFGLCGSTTYLIAAIVFAIAILPICAAAQPTVNIFTDSDKYQFGDTIEVGVAGNSGGQAMWVDVYLGLVTHDGALYTLQPDGWAGDIGPWMPDVYIPSRFEMGRTPILWMNVPCMMPPLQDVGEYSFVTVLTHPGTTDWASDLSLASFTVAISAGQDYYVSADSGDDANDGSEDAPWRTIAHALARGEGSEENPVTIHIAAGTYSASTNNETFPLNMRSWVSLVGEAALETIVNAEDAAYHVILCDGVMDTSIEGLTITGGNACAQDGDDARGGGVLCIKSFLTIADNIFIGNFANWKLAGGVLGGSAICLIDSSPLITGNVIKGNQAEYGGAIAFFENSGGRLEGNTIMLNTGSGIYCERSSPVINDNTITSNSQNGIYNRYSSPTITNCVIQENATEYGHGISCSSFCAVEIEGNIIRRNGCGEYSSGVFVTEDSAAEVSDNTISENRGAGVSAFGPCSVEARGNSIEDNDGSGILCDYDCVLKAFGNVISNNTTAVKCRWSRVLVENNEIEDNVNLAGYFGGAITLSGCTAEITDNRLSGNVSRDCGGALYLEDSVVHCLQNRISNCTATYGGGIFSVDSVVTLSDILVADCSALDSGGAVYLNGLWAQMRRCTIAHNSAPENSSIDVWGLCELEDCIVWGNAGDLSGCEVTYCCLEEPVEGEGNICAVPLFVRGPFGSYYLDPKSPCVDAGSYSFSPGQHSGSTTQADGTPDTGIIDMGYHYPLP